MQQFWVGKSSHEKFHQFHRKTPALESLFNKVISPNICPTQEGFFVKILRTPILKSTCRRLLQDPRKIFPKVNLKVFLIDWWLIKTKLDEYLATKLQGWSQEDWVVKPSFTFKVNYHVSRAKVTGVLKLENVTFAFDFTFQLFITSSQFFGY